MFGLDAAETLGQAPLASGREVLAVLRCTRSRARGASKGPCRRAVAGHEGGHRTGARAGAGSGPRSRSRARRRSARGARPARHPRRGPAQDACDRADEAEVAQIGLDGLRHAGLLHLDRDVLPVACARVRLRGGSICHRRTVWSCDAVSPSIVAGRPTWRAGAAKRPRLIPALTRARRRRRATAPPSDRHGRPPAWSSP